MQIPINDETKMPEYFQFLCNSKGGVLQKMLAAGHIGRTHAIDEHGKVVVITKQPFTDHNTPWHMTNMDGDRMCNHYMDILFVTMGIIPKRCLHCWKVVARPSTVFELMMVKEAQIQMTRQDPTCWCKCGIEEREYVHGNYGAYWYTNSIEAGLDRLDQVRAVMASINPEMPVFLKRGCTEIEEKYGDPTKWEEVRKQLNHQDTEDITDLVVEKRKGIRVQPDSAKELVQIRWLTFANDRADKTAKDLNGGFPYIKDYMKFERRIEDVKEESNTEEKDCEDPGEDCETCPGCCIKEVDSESGQSVEPVSGEGTKILGDVQCRDNLGLLASTE